ncbi:MAG: endonuclease/exonuclease/phosphatase family protein [Planctomycetota bacterium]
METGEQPGAPPPTRPRSLWFRFFVYGGTAATTFLGFLHGLSWLAAESYWLADLVANLRVQWLIAGIAVLLLACILRHRRLIAAALVVTILPLAVVIGSVNSETTRRPNATKTVNPEGSATEDSRSAVRLAFVNVRTSNRSSDQVIAWIRSIDVDWVAVLEVDSWWYQQLRDGLADFPHTLAEPSDRGNFGMAVYSKVPLGGAQMRDFGCGVPSFDWPDSAWGFRLIATHPVPPMGARGFRQRNTQLRNIADQVASGGRPGVVMGDLNLTPWSPLLADLQSRSALQRCTSGWGGTPTWYRFPRLPLGGGLPLGLPLDHVLIDPTISLLDHQIGPHVGSDHRGVVVELLSRSPASSRPSPEAGRPAGT